MRSAIAKATIAILHQGRYNPARKLKVAISNVLNNNLMVSDQELVKEIFPMMRLSPVSDDCIIQSLKYFPVLQVSRKLS